jgi:hypothetical protein
VASIEPADELGAFLRGRLAEARTRGARTAA